MSKITYTIVALLCFTSHTFAQTELTVTVDNLQPAGGLFFTPVWVGFHDGTFDSFDVGGNASAALEAIAEEGATMLLEESFEGQGVDGVIVQDRKGVVDVRPVADPGELLPDFVNVGL